MQRPSLLTQRGGCRLHPSDELAPSLTLAPMARLPMSDHRPDSSFRSVVGWLDAILGYAPSGSPALGLAHS